MDYSQEIKKLIIDASACTNKPLIEQDFYIIHQPVKHKPLSLPNDKMAVYTFVYKGIFLKIGQANVKSKARYQSHPYNIGSARSTLAQSLLNDTTMNGLVNKNNVNQWIKDNCERFDVIIDAKHKKEVLNFIEGLLHYK
ncbi:hypothetical protein JV173_03690 [Acholeplasma equirhinis]|uniref:hypothetical protein n=1 Tax=Acholeplasma equirhinis TaxID=555393 RepID=UPI00197AD45A|nr:hypothetical protein [Acholeplasma equirhinis]MBN3490612.1 hypothetical protein [Acholeplasma equirhinis]